MRPVPAASSRIRASTARLLSLGPSRVDHLPAFRIALGLAIPLSVLLVTGHVEWAMYVGFGAFTGIYSRYEPTRMRFRRQSMAGALLTVCVTIGAALARLGESMGDAAESWTVLGIGAPRCAQVEGPPSDPLPWGAWPGPEPRRRSSQRSPATRSAAGSTRSSCPRWSSTPARPC